jgi:hypothetical protein
MDDSEKPACPGPRPGPLRPLRGPGPGPERLCSSCCRLIQGSESPGVTRVTPSHTIPSLAKFPAARSLRLPECPARAWQARSQFKTRNSAEVTVTQWVTFKAGLEVPTAQQMPVGSHVLDSKFHDHLDPLAS